MKHYKAFVILFFVICMIIIITIILKIYLNKSVASKASLQSQLLNMIPQGLICNTKIPESKQLFYPMVPQTIFVSIASYRDKECSKTIESIYSNARNPERIYIGVCEQNNYNDDSELCTGSINKWSKNIKTYKMNYKEAKGPTYARYFCSKLWAGQQYYLQIDSHTQFVKDWDLLLITMLEQCRNKSSKPVLSAYPPTETQLTLSGMSVMDNCKISDNGLPIFFAGFWKMNEVPEEPIKSPKPFVAGGFMFLDGTFLYDVPYDPYLSGLFQGEETLLSARLFTNGYDIYAPNKLVCTHHYNREGSLYHEDMPNFQGCKIIAEQRVLYLLGLSYNKSLLNEHKDFLYSNLNGTDTYGLGNKRSIQDFWKTAGINVVDGSLKSCT
jgi:[Skp1-protein]-hydroxyproline N-acetylglucosaminyltransferase